MTTTITESKLARKFGFQPTTEDRMFCYLWSENDTECKFGERWVKAGLDPELDCWARVRESIGVRKHVVDDGTIKLHKIWDVTDLAKRPDVRRYFMGSRMDDYLRGAIMHRVSERSEFHRIDWSTAVARIDKSLASKQVLTQGMVLLRSLQEEKLRQAMELVRAAHAAGKDVVTIIANLCARFGKTIFSLALFNAMAAEFGNDIMIVPVYWLSVLTSFESEVAKYREFNDITIIDAKNPEAGELAAAALAAGRRILVQVSLHGYIDNAGEVVSEDGENIPDWCDRHAWLREYDTSRFFVFADEADFGTHTDSQRAKMAFLFKED